jgi:hypothetical protein
VTIKDLSDDLQAIAVERLFEFVSVHRQRLSAAIPGSYNHAQWTLESCHKSLKEEMK